MFLNCFKICFVPIGISTFLFHLFVSLLISSVYLINIHKESALAALIFPVVLHFIDFCPFSNYFPSVCLFSFALWLFFQLFGCYAYYFYLSYFLINIFNVIHFAVYTVLPVSYKILYVVFSFLFSFEHFLQYFMIFF